MATAQRVFWESVIFVSFLVILTAVVLWSNSRVERRAEALAAQHDEALETSAKEHRAELEELQQDLDERLRQRLRHEAESTFSAFEAGARTAIAARWGRYLGSAIEGLVERPGVIFAHILTPSGRIITTSDEELAAAGRLPEESTWVLEVVGIVSRPGEGPRTLEVAGPVEDGGRLVAILWIGYDLTTMADRDL